MMQAFNHQQLAQIQKQMAEKLRLMNWLSPIGKMKPEVQQAIRLKREAKQQADRLTQQQMIAALEQVQVREAYIDLYNHEHEDNWMLLQAELVSALMQLANNKEKLIGEIKQAHDESVQEAERLREQAKRQLQRQAEQAGAAPQANKDEDPEALQQTLLDYTKLNPKVSVPAALSVVLVIVRVFMSSPDLSEEASLLDRYGNVTSLLNALIAMLMVSTLMLYRDQQREAVVHRLEAPKTMTPTKEPSIVVPVIEPLASDDQLFQDIVIEKVQDLMNTTLERFVQAAKSSLTAAVTSKSEAADTNTI